MRTVTTRMGVYLLGALLLVGLGMAALAGGGPSEAVAPEYRGADGPPGLAAGVRAASEVEHPADHSAPGAGPSHTRSAPPPVCVTGIVRDSGGAALAGATVHASGYTPCVTDSSGQYVLQLPLLAFSPDVELTASAAGHKAFARRVRQSQAHSLHFILGRRSRLHGRVTDQHGAIVAGCAVRLLGGRARAQRVTGSDGRFAFDEATDTARSLAVVPPEPRGAWRTPGVVTLRGREEPHEVTLFRVPRGRATLTVTLLDADTGLGLEPDTVILRRLDLIRAPGESVSAAKIATRPGGLLKAVGLRPGLWSLRIKLADGRVATRRFFLSEEDRERRLHVEMGQPGVVSGEVVLPAAAFGDGISELSIRLPGCPDARFVPAGGARPVSGGDARLAASATVPFSFENIPSLQVVRLVVSMGEFVAVRDFHLKSGGRARLTLAPIRAGTLELVGDRPAPMPQATFAWRADGGSWSTETAVRELKGTTTLVRHHIPAGPVQWRLRCRPSVSQALHTVDGHVIVVAGESVRVVVDLPGPEPR